MKLSFFRAAASAFPGFATVLAIATLVSACGGSEGTSADAREKQLIAGSATGSVSASRSRALAVQPAAAATITNDQLFSWAQRTYPQLFGSAAPAVIPALVYQGRVFDVRFYSTGNYLGVSDDVAYGYGPFVNNLLTSFGQVSNYACQVAPSSCIPTQPAAPEICTDSNRSAAVRDAWCWPFSASSIWNTGIGSAGTFQSTRPFSGAPKVRLDDVLLIQTKPTDPERDVFAPAYDLVRCTPPQARSNPQWDGIGGLKLRFPDRYKTPALRDDYRPNLPATLLQPDNNSIAELQPLARCEETGPLFGWTAHRSTPSRPSTELGTIRGSGDFGSHGGSALSAIGGTLRLGEISSTLPIRHALKILVTASRYLYYNRSTDRGFRWPALRNDNYAASSPAVGGYGGSNIELQMGSLLAIPRTVNVDLLPLTTQAGRKIARALQDYGAYIADDAFEDAFYIVAERGVAAEVSITDDGVRSGAFYNDIIAIFSRLQVVTNSRSDKVGGGGQALV